ncbi:MAG: hypothetical protein WBN75_05625 [Verrucomicrobiia bacterium]|jgi:hypothetical protein
MTDEAKPSPLPGGQFLVYQTEDGKLKIDVRFKGETVWLTRQHLSDYSHSLAPKPTATAP